MDFIDYNLIPSEFEPKSTQIPLFRNYKTITNDYVIKMIYSDRIPSRFDVEKISRFFREHQNYGDEKIVNLESPLAIMLIAYDNYRVKKSVLSNLLGVLRAFLKRMRRPHHYFL